MTAVTAWGNLAPAEHSIVALRDRDSAPGLVASAERPGLATGLMRSYGDEPLNTGGVAWDMRGLSRLIAFDSETGDLTCEAGVTIADIQRTFAPRGWMMPVTPGTKHVTVGGAIANDVHGKNHHVAGSLGNHVVALTLARTDGTVTTLDGPSDPMFRATVGGMGLTGVILQATIRMHRVAGPWMSAEDVVFGDLDEFFSVSAESRDTYDYSVAWVDITTHGGGRGIFTRGNNAVEQPPAPPPGRVVTMPFTPPLSLVNSLSLRVFNRGYFALKRSLAREALVHYDPFFYPLDGIGRWDRMYGPRGFHQYQCVVPSAGAREPVSEMLKQIRVSGLGSFLGVLKVMGDEPPIGTMSFPREGVTFALDFPERGDATAALFVRLDAIVSEAGGRLYAAKDARMPKEMFEAGYPGLDEFVAYRDPGISSEMSRRLMGE
ncbi:FAD-binding oxidoreductase [Demequina mangrovi]|uniref:FAD/FMN-containing dehydrogenase n=1 Tax=Demequina mangrovi TaxID=1043493 RepID=A0A1H6YRG7_9MICO|nr:FAD-binding oxidoreductase [Demequina mangrovi]SEJ39842.1 FAD/FMN-containing dehydrogenase [Demequina mangrovi]